MDEKPRLLGGCRSMDPHRTMISSYAARRVRARDPAQGERHHAERRASASKSALRIMRISTAASCGADAPTSPRAVAHSGRGHVFTTPAAGYEDYVHRIGAGPWGRAAGDAIIPSAARQCYSLPDIEDYIGLAIPRAALTEDASRDHGPASRRIAAGRVRWRTLPLMPSALGDSRGRGGRPTHDAVLSASDADGRPAPSKPRPLPEWSLRLRRPPSADRHRAIVRTGPRRRRRAVDRPHRNPARPAPAHRRRRAT